MGPEGRPVGAAQSISVDVRLIAATHQDLEAGVERGTFWGDFYYRLWWAVLEVPPLRARREDIELLVEHFRGKSTDVATSASTSRASAATRWPSSRAPLARERAGAGGGGQAGDGPAAPRMGDA